MLWAVHSSQLQENKCIIIFVFGLLIDESFSYLLLKNFNASTQPHSLIFFNSSSLFNTQLTQIK